MRIPPALERLVAALSRLPGVGEKTATRYAFHILGEPDSYAVELGEAVSELHGSVRHCRRCHNLSEADLCHICASPTREHCRICVTEGIQELIAIERTGEYRGLYHVLHGVVSPVRGVGPDDIELASLVARVAAEGTTEVILATNADVEGEATALFIHRQLLKFPGLSVTRIAMGVPLGGDLEYLDQVTLARALRDRREV